LINVNLGTIRYATDRALRGRQRDGREGASGPDPGGEE